MMQHQIDKKKLLIYVIFFLALSTLNNIAINNFNLVKISKIEVSGLNNKDNLYILNQLKFLELENIFFLNKENIINTIKKNNLVENFYIKKKYPSSLDIKLNKTKFLANIDLNGNHFFVGSNGKLIKADYLNNDLPYLSERTSIDEFLHFTDVIKKSIFDYNQISNIYFFPSKRWDIKTKKEILIKLPIENINEALKNAHYIINDKKFLNIKYIDLRIKNQIILNNK